MYTPPRYAIDDIRQQKSGREHSHFHPPQSDVRETLEAEAKTLGIGLASYLRQMAAKAARDATRARLRAGSAAVATHIAEDRSARNFMGEWGTPGAEG